MDVKPLVAQNLAVNAVQQIELGPSQGVDKSQKTTDILLGMKEIATHISESNKATQMALMAKDESVTKLTTQSVEYALLQKNDGMFSFVDEGSKLRFNPKTVDEKDTDLADLHLEKQNLPVTSIKDLGHLSSSDEDTEDELELQNTKDRNVSRRELRSFAALTVQKDMAELMPSDDSNPNPLSCGDVRSLVTSLALDTHDYNFDVSKNFMKISDSGELETLKVHLETKLSQDEGVVLSMYDKVAGHDTVFYFPPLSEQIDPEKPSAFLFQADMGDGFTRELNFENWMDAKAGDSVAYDDIFGYMGDTITKNVDFDRASRLFDIDGEAQSQTLLEGYQEKYSLGQKDQEFKVHLHNVDPDNFLQNVQEFSQKAFQLNMG